MDYQTVPKSSTSCSSSTGTTTTDPAMITKGWIPFFAAAVVLTLFTLALSSTGNGNVLKAPPPTKPAKDIQQLLSLFTMSWNHHHKLSDDCAFLTRHNAGWAAACTCIIDDHCQREYEMCEDTNCDCDSQVKEIDSLCVASNNKDDFDFDAYDSCLNKGAERALCSFTKDLITCVVQNFKECIIDTLPAILPMVGGTLE
mmetsp:Transcript_32663/g.36679  ORF Transcript_32663/g.36679 Transcript_32663/m.36679 type:complete len:199 (+) Transcript_32663:185-781(+)